MQSKDYEAGYKVGYKRSRFEAWLQAFVVIVVALAVYYFFDW